jgi:branched-chain amino acid transport system substrate-binding protein
VKATGKNLTRKNLVNTLQTKGTSLLTPGLVPLSYSKTNHYGFSGSQVITINNGATTSISPVYVSTNNGPITVYHGSLKSPPSSI